MKHRKNYSLIVSLFVLLISIKTKAQTDNTKLESWLALKNTAHSIGFCVFHIHQEVCKEHSHIKPELVKISDPYSEVYYFEIDSTWAQNRIHDMAAKDTSKPEDYLILFDIDQGATQKLNDTTKTSNSYKMFSIINLTDSIKLNTHRENKSHVLFFISTNKENSIVSNTMFREFFSHKLGRLDSKIEISLSGVNTLSNYHNFKDSFIKFVE